jgi:hypothetical protein
MKDVIHKANYKQKVTCYMGFGHEERIPSTVCRGAKGYWSEKNKVRGFIARNWKDVTCKKCLNKKDKY